MKLIIDIPKDVYEEIMTHNRELRESGKSAYYFEGLIQNGTPYNPSGDAISREALKEKLQARYDNGEEDFDKGYNIGLEAAIDLIDNAPADMRP